jgi:2-(1,2-epoxy-1,2-dihydrophenyl)acetyl-CoA isomerase
MPDSAAPMFPDVEYTSGAGLATVLLNRPAALNASTSRMLDGLLAALDFAAADPEVRAIVLAGRGRAFCAGADLKEIVPEGTERQLLERYLPVAERIATTDAVVIAAVAGSAIGVGMSLALICDLVVMAEDARLWAPFTRLGLVPDGGASWLLVRQLGYHRAFRIVAEGQPLTAREALDLGLANRLAAPGEHLSTAEAWGREIAAQAGPSLAASKRLLRLAAGATFETVFRAEARDQGQCAQSDFFRAAREKILGKS